MIPNIDILTQEITEERYANRTYKLQVGDGIIHNSHEIDYTTPCSIADISPQNSKLKVEISYPNDIPKDDIVLSASNGDGTDIVYYPHDDNEVIKEVQYRDPITMLSTHKVVEKSVIGQSVKIDDIAPTHSDCKVTIKSKNLFNPAFVSPVGTNLQAYNSCRSVIFGSNVFKILKPNTTYVTSFKAECISLPDNVTITTPYLGFRLFETNTNFKKAIGYDIWRNMAVGDTFTVERWFTTPSNLYDEDANFEIALESPYGIDANGEVVCATIKFTEIQIEEGTVKTPYTPWSDPWWGWVIDSDGNEYYPIPNGDILPKDIPNPLLTLGNGISASSDDLVLVVDYYTLNEIQLPLKVKYDEVLQIEAVRVNGYIDDVDALKQTIYYILSIERYKHIIYSWDYGVELLDLFGKPMTYVIAEIPRRITEALTQDNRIDDVIDFEFTHKGKWLHTTFKVVSNAATFSVDWEVEI